MGSLVMNDAVARDPLHSSSSSWMNPSGMRSGGALENSNTTVQPQHSSYDAFNSQRSLSTSSSSSVSASQARHSTPSSSQPSSASSVSSTSTVKPSSTLQAEPRAAAAPPSPQITPSSHQSSSSSSQQPVTSAAGDVPAATTASTAHPEKPGMGSPSPSPRRIKVKDLQHIQTVAREDPETFGLSRPQSRSSQHDSPTPSPQFEISEMPVSDVIEMVAGLLTKITTTNDRQHEHLHRNPIPDGTTTLSQQTSSVLSFHGKNVPSITILSYLSRIHKYCPTTYEIFLSLLVYFDRMTERVNSGPLQSMRQAGQQSLNKYSTERAAPSNASAPASLDTPPSSGQRPQQQQPASSASSAQEPPSPPLSDSDPFLSHFFVVDSYNIHRLVIAGVTCASKFFSDVFYTNSRYAKVGGLPLVELNHLELQFLLLNDFRLSIPVEELEAYATMLVEFYAREVVTQQLSQP